MSGMDLYNQLDRYFADAAQDLLLGAPQDDSDLIHHILFSFKRYSVGAQSANRLLNIGDVIERVAKSAKSTDTRDQLTWKLREKRADELRKWGDIDAGPEALAEAESVNFAWRSSNL